MGFGNFASAARLGLRSYRGRYLWLVVVLSLALISIAYIGQTLVREAGENMSSRATNNAQLLATLSDVSRSLATLNSNLLNFSIDPSYTPAIDVTNSAEHLADTLQRLRSRLSLADSPEMDGMYQLLIADGDVLLEQIEQLVSIRQSTQEWIPASRTMIEVMLPFNRQFKTHMQNINSMLNSEPEVLPVRYQLERIHANWQTMVGEVRLLVANRFGSFDADSDAAMEARATNAATFIDRTRGLLIELPTLLATLDDDLLLDEYNELLEAFNGWVNAAQQLRVLLDQQDWRRDMFFLHSQIDPLLVRMQQRVTSIRLQTETEGQHQLQQALDNAELLATVISSVAGAMVLLFLAGYLTFEVWLLRPIRYIANQLKREAQGEAAEPLDINVVAEARALVDAFEQMHAQVRRRELRLDHMAHHDPLTGLPNRVLFRERLEEHLKQLEDDSDGVALLFLDLDRFKQINDSHGHLVGDQLLVQVARRLRSVFRAEDTVARLSGDEFAVLLHHFSDREELESLAQKVVQVLKPAFVIDGHTYHSSASIGLTLAPQDGGDADQLIQHADAAMYHAKAAGRSGFCHFTQDMVEQSSAQLTLETELYTAVEKQQLELFLQPVVDIKNLQVHAYECLLRWRHPQRGVLTPSDFLATLEDIGLLQSITEWTIDQLSIAGITNHQTVSINLPAKLLHNPSFAPRLEQLLSQGDINPNHLIVEITEDSFSMDLAEAAQLLHRLHKLGVLIALDDFGTGQSSLSHLRAFPFDLVKIDRSFIRDIPGDPQDATLVRAIIGLANTLGIEVVGEGVETREQHQFLLGEGCRFGQGYLFGTPRLMREPRKRSSA